MRDHQALGDAVTARRKEIALSLRDAASLSRRIDVEVNHHDSKVPGIGETTWMRMGQGVEAERYPHTLHLVDQTLRWPDGTAHALLEGEQLPDGPIADGPCVCAIKRDGAYTGSVDELLNPTVSDVEDDERRAEVDLLRREVIRLIDRVETVEKGLQRALRAINSGP